MAPKTPHHRMCDVCKNKQHPDCTMINNPHLVGRVRHRCLYYRCPEGQRRAIEMFRLAHEKGLQNLIEKIEVEGKEIPTLKVMTRDKSGYIDHDLKFIAITPEGKYVYTGQKLSLEDLKNQIGTEKAEQILEEFRKINS